MSCLSSEPHLHPGGLEPGGAWRRAGGRRGEQGLEHGEEAQKVVEGRRADTQQPDRREPVEEDEVDDGVEDADDDVEEGDDEGGEDEDALGPDDGEHHRGVAGDVDGAPDDGPDPVGAGPGGIAEESGEEVDHPEEHHAEARVLHLGHGACRQGCHQEIWMCPLFDYNVTKKLQFLLDFFMFLHKFETLYPLFENTVFWRKVGIQTYFRYTNHGGSPTCRVAHWCMWYVKVWYSCRSPPSPRPCRGTAGGAAPSPGAEPGRAS